MFKVTRNDVKAPETHEACKRFMEWWKGDEERSKCLLHQAVHGYMATFPARVYLLLVELLEEKDVRSRD